MPLAPGFELISRAKNLRCKNLRFHLPRPSQPRIELGEGPLVAAVNIINCLLEEWW
jgi:hypothetical protein